MTSSFFFSFTVCATLLTGSFAQADETGLSLMSEDLLRSLVVFGSEDDLKFAECGGQNSSRCTYVWGGPDKMDEVRSALGAEPVGKKILVSTKVLEGNSISPYYNHLASTFGDTEPVADLGLKAVWSQTNGELLIQTDESTIFRFRTEMIESDENKAVAISIAGHVLNAP